MKRTLVYVIVIAVALAMLILATPAFAGQTECKACNKPHQNSGHACFQYKIVVSYKWWTMGPARKSDGRKDNLYLIDRWIGAYEDRDCRTLLDSAGYKVKGCRGTLYPAGLPENGGVI